MKGRSAGAIVLFLIGLTILLRTVKGGSNSLPNRVRSL